MKQAFVTIGRQLQQFITTCQRGDYGDNTSEAILKSIEIAQNIEGLLALEEKLVCAIPFNIESNKAAIEQYLQNKIAAQHPTIQTADDSQQLQYMVNLLTITVTDNASLALARIVIPFLEATEKASNSIFYRLFKSRLQRSIPDVDQKMQARIALLPVLRDAITEFLKLKSAEPASTVAVEQPQNVAAVLQQVGKLNLAWDKIRKKCEGEIEDKQNKIQEFYEKISAKTASALNYSANLKFWQELHVQSSLLTASLRTKADAHTQKVIELLKVPVQNCKAQLTIITEVITHAGSLTALQESDTAIQNLTADLTCLNDPAIKIPESLQSELEQVKTDLAALLKKKYAFQWRFKLKNYLTERAETYKIRDTISSLFAFLFGWLGYRTEKSQRESYVNSTLRVLQRFATEETSAVIQEVQGAWVTGKAFSPRANFKFSLKAIVTAAEQEFKNGNLSPGMKSA